MRVKTFFAAAISAACVSGVANAGFGSGPAVPMPTPKPPAPVEEPAPGYLGCWQDGEYYCGMRTNDGDGGTGTDTGSPDRSEPNEPGGYC